MNVDKSFFKRRIEGLGEINFSKPYRFNGEIINNLGQCSSTQSVYIPIRERNRETVKKWLFFSQIFLSYGDNSASLVFLLELLEI